MTWDWVWEVLSAAAFAVAAWAGLRVAKVDTLEEDIRYIRGRVDDLYDIVADKEDR